MENKLLDSSGDKSPTMSPKTHVFPISEYRSSVGFSVSDYFVRFDWALQNSKICENEYHNYARVHMGEELNTALKKLVCPRLPENLTYEEIKSVLSQYFDGKRNVYAEGFKFRQIKQEYGESLAAFVLRLKQAVIFCDYGDALDRMLIEQMIFGLDSRSICDEVIAKQPKNFKEAYEIAYSREVTHRATNAVNTSENTVTEQTCKLGHTPVKTKKHSTMKLSDKLSNDGYPSYEGENLCGFVFAVFGCEKEQFEESSLYQDTLHIESELTIHSKVPITSWVQLLEELEVMVDYYNGSNNGKEIFQIIYNLMGTHVRRCKTLSTELACYKSELSKCINFSHSFCYFRNTFILDCTTDRINFEYNRPGDLNRMSIKFDCKLLKTNRKGVPFKVLYEVRSYDEDPHPSINAVLEPYGISAESGSIDYCFKYKNGETAN